MAASGGAGKAAQTVQDLLASPYVRRAVEDPAVRDNAKVAYQSAREALDRVKGSDNVVNALFDDRKLQEQLASTGRGIAGAREHLIVAPAKKKRHIGRAILVVVVGAGCTGVAGSTVIGRITADEGGILQVATNPAAPGQTTDVRHDTIKTRQVSPTSLMPPGLINAMNADEVADLLAYILSGGDKRGKMFRR